MGKKINDVYGANLLRFRDEIPPAYRDLFQKLIPESETFPYTILLYPDRWGFSKSSSKLVCVFTDQIIVFEKIKKDVTATSYGFQNILYMETGTILLYSWITIHGIADDKPSTTTLEFNTVLEKLFQPIVARIRKMVNPSEETDEARNRLREERAKFDPLVNLNYKFMNYGKSSLMLGEMVLKIILQPLIQAPYLRFFSRMVSPPHLTILTDSEFILIKEEAPRSMNRGIRYGGVWYYLFRDKIDRAFLKEENGKKGCVTLQVELSGAEIMESTFEDAHRPELEYICKEITRLPGLPGSFYQSGTGIGKGAPI